MDNLIEFAKEQCEIFPEDSEMGRYLRETLKMLQVEPCEDAISKASVFEIVGNLMSIPYDLDRRITEKDVSESMDEIRVLPPVKPTRKKGKWVDINDREEWYGDQYRCSLCGKVTIDNGLYCPHCGAEMGSEEA